MVCYIVPTAAAIVISCLRKSKKGLQENVRFYWLNLLLYGATIFGLVDHWWNGELFLIGENLLLDLALGVTITALIFLAWGLITVLDKTKATEPSVVQ